MLTYYEHNKQMQCMFMLQCCQGQIQFMSVLMGFINACYLPDKVRKCFNQLSSRARCHRQKILYLYQLLSQTSKADLLLPELVFFVMVRISINSFPCIQYKEKHMYFQMYIYFQILLLLNPECPSNTLRLVLLSVLFPSSCSIRKCVWSHRNNIIENSHSSQLKYLIEFPKIQSSAHFAGEIMQHITDTIIAHRYLLHVFLN